MKKILSLVLVLAMVLGTFSFAVAAPTNDVAGTDYEDAVTRLTSLKVLNGYPDGTFKPDNTITRAEFSAAVVKVLGLNIAANAAKGSASFTDVPAGHWATGYINIASKMGYVKGMGDGRFAPEAPITYEQAVTLVVRALGYEEAAKNRGGYPFGYLVVASEEGVTDDVKGVQGAPAPRGMVALLLDNALTVPMMIQTGYNSDGTIKWVKSGTDDDIEKVTILTDKLKIDEIEGRVISNFKVNSKLDENEIEIDVKDGKVTKYEVADGIDVDAILGLEVTAWEDDDKLFKAEIDTDDRDILVDMYDESGVDEADVYLYVTNDEYEWAKGAELYVNNDDEKTSALPDKAYGRFVLDEDGDIAFAYVFDIKNGDKGVVTDVEKDTITYINNAGREDYLDDLDDADNIYVFNKKLEEASYNDIEEDSAIYYWADGDDYYIIVDNNTVEGELDGIRSDKRIEVDGNKYDPTYYVDTVVITKDDGDDYEKATTDALEDFDEEEVIIVLDINEEYMLVRGDVEATSSAIYGIVTYTTDARYPELSVFAKTADKEKGEEIDYVLEERSDVTINNSKDLYDLKYDSKGVGNLSYAVVGFKLNKDGEIDEDFRTDEETGLAIVEGEASSKIDGTNVITRKVSKAVDKKYVEDSSHNKYYIGKNTIIMKALNGAEEATKAKLDPSILSNDNIIDRSFSGRNVVIFGKANGNADLIVFTDNDFEGKSDDYFYGIVTGKPWKKGDYIAKIDVVGEGEKDYVVDSKADFARSTIVKFRINSDDEVEKVTSFKLKDKKYTGATEYTIDNVEEDDYRLTVSDSVYKKVSYKVVEDVVIYDLNSSKSKVNDTVRFTRLRKGDKVVFLENEDAEIVAMVVVDYAKEDEDEDEDDVEADGKLRIDFIVGEDNVINLFVGDDEEKVSYYVDDAVILDKNGDRITVKGTTIKAGEKVSFELIKGTDKAALVQFVEYPKE